MTPPALHFRPAQASDAHACAPLIFASGTGEHRFYLGASEQQCIAFLRFAFVLNHGRYSWRRHYVACTSNGTVLSEMAAHHHRDIRFDDLHLIWTVLRFFGFLKTTSILWRGPIIGPEMPPPKRGQTLLASFATDKRVRGMGVFTAMLAHALTSGWLNGVPGNQYLLDVRLDNIGARRLYERFGFIAQPRRHPPHARLPVELTAMRMAWSAQGIAALRAQARSVQTRLDKTDESLWNDCDDELPNYQT